MLNNPLPPEDSEIWVVYPKNFNIVLKEVEE